MKHLPIFLFLAFILFPLALHAQSDGWIISHNYGISTPNNFNMPEQTHAVFGIEVGWRHRTQGDQWWMQRRHYPSFGLKGSALYTIDGIAGTRFGLAGYVWTPVNSRLSTHWGLGLSCYTKSFYFTRDTANFYITTLLNCLIDIGLDYRLSPTTSLAFSFMHASNGKTNYPNKGLNYLQFSLEYDLTPVAPNEQSTPTLAMPSFRRHELGFTLSGAIAHEDGYDGRLYPCYDASLNYEYYLNPIIALGATLDLWFNGSHWDNIRSGEYNWNMPVYTSALASIEGFWGPISLKGGVGSVLFAPQEARILRLYERAGVYYNWSGNYVGVAINAHGGRAEFIEWSYGHRFKLKA
ncbi:MAG: acyloxyacyl hydrolase [Bacteroidales bacterium]|nr:acyloxyacyl hydrolase [Bacteroidales bacterium]